MKVYVLIKRTSEDYHGSSDDIVAIYDSAESAQAKEEKLAEENYDCNVEYFVDQYSVVQTLNK